MLLWQLINQKKTKNFLIITVCLYLSQVQWKPLMEEIFATNFTDSDTLYVVDPSYLEKLRHMLTKFQDR